MFCPNCGTEQESKNVAMCSYCGLPLGGVKEILDSNQTAIQRVEKKHKEERDDMIAKAAFVALAAIPIGVGIFKAKKPEPQPARPDEIR